MYQRNAFPPFAVLRAFDAFGRLGGIRKAAQALGIDHAVISRHLRALESQVGTALIDRTSADQWLTEDGRTYHARVAAALADIADATETLRKRHDGRFLIWASPGFAYHWLLPRLPDFNDRYPSIDLALRPSDNSVNFLTNEADGDIRYLRAWQGYEPPAGVRVMEFDRPTIFPVASPAYLEGLSKPLEHVSDLLDLRLLHEEDDEEWRHWLTAHGLALPNVIPGQRLWHANLMIDAAQKGQGIALANHRLVGDLLQEGRLRKLSFSNEIIRRVELGGYNLIARADRWTSVSLVRFREWLKSQISDQT